MMKAVSNVQMWKCDRLIMNIKGKAASGIANVVLL